MSLPIANVGAYKNMAASAAISTGPCQLLGFYVNSTNAGTLVIDDGGVAISGAITPLAGRFHRFPANIGAAANATIGGTALNVTFFYAAGH